MIGYKRRRRSRRRQSTTKLRKLAGPMVIANTMEFPSTDDAHAHENIDQRIQRESISFMDVKLYKAAVLGKIDPFKDYESLDLLLTPNKNTVLHVFITTLKAETKKSTAFVDQILDKSPSLLVQANAKGETPLHLASRRGHALIVKVLISRAKAQSNEDIERGTMMAKEMIRMTNVVKETALHEAARLNHLQVVKILTREDPDFMYLANEGGETPLYLAVERGYRQFALEILENCKSIEHHGPNGRTTLHEAVINMDEGT